MVTRREKITQREISEKKLQDAKEAECSNLVAHRASKYYNGVQPGADLILLLDSSLNLSQIYERFHKYFKGYEKSLPVGKN